MRSVFLYLYQLVNSHQIQEIVMRTNARIQLVMQIELRRQLLEKSEQKRIKNINGLYAFERQ